MGTRIRNGRLRLEALLAAALLSVTLACSGSEAADEPRMPAGSALHLFDRAPRAGGAVEPKLDPRTPEWTRADGVWVLNEPLAPEDWIRDGRVGASARWLARLRHPLAFDRTLVPIDELGAPGPRRRAGSGRDRIEEPGTAALLKEGLVNLLRPAEEGPPPPMEVAYFANRGSVANDLPTVHPTDGTFAPRTRILGEEARRSLGAPAPWSRTWDVDVPPGARLRFAWATGSRLARYSPEGVRLVPVAARPPQSVTARVVVEATTQGAEEVLWTSGAGAQPVPGRFEDVLLDLGAYAGGRVALRFEFTTTGTPGAGAPALLAEPIVEAPFTADPAPPNVLLLLLDTLRADRLGCYGWERAHTPNLDRLAARGVRFENVTSAAPWTLPSIASLMSSLYVSEHGISSGEALPADALTIAQALRDESYLTAAFTEGGYAGKAYGMTKGFDVFQTGPRDVMNTVERAQGWLATVQSPYFLFVHTYQPHVPYDAPQEWKDLLVRPYDGPEQRITGDPDFPWGRRGPDEPVSAAYRQYLEDSYDAEIAHTDDAVGELLDWLEEQGHLENLVVIVTSDHGEEFGEHGHYGHGWSLYEEQLRVPLILYGPGRFEGGLVPEHRVHGVDVAPTIAELAGVDVPAQWSGVPLSLEAPERERAVFSTYYTRWDRQPAIAYLFGGRKFVSFPSRLRVCDPHPTRSVFDLVQDPGEQRDLLGAGEDEADRWLRAAANAWKSYPGRFLSEEAAVDSQGASELEALGYIGR